MYSGNPEFGGVEFNALQGNESNVSGKVENLTDETQSLAGLTPTLIKELRVYREMYSLQESGISHAEARRLRFLRYLVFEGKVAPG